MAKKKGGKQGINNRELLRGKNTLPLADGVDKKTIKETVKVEKELLIVFTCMSPSSSMQALSSFLQSLLMVSRAEQRTGLATAWYAIKSMSICQSNGSYQLYPEEVGVVLDVLVSVVNPVLDDVLDLGHLLLDGGVGAGAKGGNCCVGLSKHILIVYLKAFQMGTVTCSGVQPSVVAAGAAAGAAGASAAAGAASAAGAAASAAGAAASSAAAGATSSAVGSTTGATGATGSTGPGPDGPREPPPPIDIRIPKNPISRDI